MKLKSTFIFLALVSLGLSACKKDGTVISDTQLIGNWKELGSTPITRYVTFFKDKSFELSVGHPDQGDALLKGYYEAKGDSLKVMVLREQQSRTPLPSAGSSSILYDYATYKINGSTLIINYTTYPADAPVATVVTFRRAVKKTN